MPVQAPMKKLIKLKVKFPTEFLISCNFLFKSVSLPRVIALFPIEIRGDTSVTHEIENNLSDVELENNVPNESESSPLQLELGSDPATWPQQVITGAVRVILVTKIIIVKIIALIVFSLSFSRKGCQN